ncbi:TetR family transcriptional regulator [Pseudarthrobacter psychrotolerans]|uniref:TetR family transcriptional regulator n=1 Tax=Pseudarthrobacter psychrotolerans TaxID=2697569 RepID=A0A6P1NRG3_9MICC|nr:TetR/AcrR family transcriptional regulator [Pseudarthrobacter psychrotolerans]QHK20122.1 TetR family transcriptional regulator [Pseudarthrobacter psychrotolerans]
MPETPSPSLRERKKVETWTALHEAAASLAQQIGVDQATVEAIAESAGVSPRTFFNYFPAKEDAVLGLREPVLDPDESAKLTGTADLLGQVSLLLVAVARSATGDTDAVRRRELLQRHPNLFRRQMDYMVKAEALVCEAVTEALAQDPAWSGRAEGFSPEETARMLVMLAAVPVKFRATSPDFDPVTGLTPGDLAPALALFHHLQRKLS